MLVDKELFADYNNVKNISKGGIIMRKTYIDNTRWITVVLVVIYHVIYIFNGVTTHGIIGPFSDGILNTPVIVVYRFGIYGAGFFIGYFVLSHDEVMDRLEKRWVIFSALAVISCIVFVVMYLGQSYPDHVVLDTLMCNVYAWLGTLGVLAFMKKWGNFENPFSKWMCRKSWGLYIFLLPSQVLPERLRFMR